jgi:type IV pilus assembly protein PilV
VQCNKQAFTLIEALVSVAIMAIGFAGVYVLVSTSTAVLNDSIEREKLNYRAAEIIETLHSDQGQIESYAHTNLDNSDCESIKLKDAKKGKPKQLKKLQTWCKKMSSEVGRKNSADRRKIRVERPVDGAKANVVSIELSGRNGKTIYIKKVFNAE